MPRSHPRDAEWTEKRRLEVARAIRSAREEMGITVTAFARHLGVVQGAVSNWENAVSFPSLENLIRIASLTGKPLSELLADVHA